MSATRLILAVCLVLLSCVFAMAGDTFTGKCVGVTDGDTISVMRDGKAEKVRLEGIDCPEKGQDFGTRAKQFTSGLVFGKVVRVHEVTRDQWGRIVGRVYAGEEDVSLELVKAGMAWHFKKYSSELLLDEAEDAARAAGVGLWSVHQPMPPWEYRRGQGRAPAVITDGEVYHGNTSSKVFHHSGCQHFNCKNCTMQFKTREEAIQAGYRPCGRCKP